MIEIKPGHCRVAHMGNDALKMKTVVIANHKGITEIYGVTDTITEKEFAKLIEEKTMKKNKIKSFFSKIGNYLFPDYAEAIPGHVFIEIEDNNTCTIRTYKDNCIKIEKVRT